jgi:hypothetical protein
VAVAAAAAAIVVVAAVVAAAVLAAELSFVLEVFGRIWGLRSWRPRTPPIWDSWRSTEFPGIPATFDNPGREKESSSHWNSR